MNTICVVSDTHGRVEKLRQILPVINTCQKFVFLGDYTRDLFGLRKEIIPEIVAVKGNCDLTSPYPDEEIFEWEGSRFFVTHGHKYRVKSDLLNLTYEAKERNCRFALYGHTHVACIDEFNGVTLINPGSLSEPRFGEPTYCMLTEEKGKIFAKIILM